MPERWARHPFFSVGNTPVFRPVLEFPFHSRFPFRAKNLLELFFLTEMGQAEIRRSCTSSVSLEKRRRGVKKHYEGLRKFRPYFFVICLVGKLAARKTVSSLPMPPVNQALIAVKLHTLWANQVIWFTALSSANQNSPWAKNDYVCSGEHFKR